MTFHRIRWRIAALYAVLILLLMGAVYILLADYVHDTYLAELETRMVSEARLLADALRAEIAASVSGDELDTQVARYETLLDARVTVVTAAGLVLSDSDRDSATLGSHLTRPEIQQALARGTGSSTRFSDTLQQNLLYVAAAVYDDQGSIVGVLRLARPVSQVEAEVHTLRGRLTLVTVIATLLALLLAFWIAERTAKPVRVLNGVVQRLAGGDLQARLIPTTHDEIGTLTTSFNEMGDRLQGMVAELDAERQRLSSVLEHMADGVLIVEGNGTVRLINPAAERMLGCVASQVVGQSLAQSARHHEMVDLWQRCRADGQEQASLVELDRQGTMLQVIATPLHARSSPTCLLILQDLTRLRQLETMRRELISNMSHELRTPLTSLKVLADTLLDGALDDPPAARRFVERIHTEVDALAQMVDELLELARIESGQVPVQLSPVAVPDVVLPPVERLTEQAQRAGLELSTDLPEGLPLVLADDKRIQQVLTNLIHNAIKFTPSGGTVTVSASTTDDEVTFSVRDTGVGIPAEVLPRIFERFFRADRSRTGKGTGLGLAIAKHLVQAHGGRIWAESREGQGSTFRFTLRVAA